MLYFLCSISSSLVRQYLGIVRVISNSVIGTFLFLLNSACTILSSTIAGPVAHAVLIFLVHLITYSGAEWNGTDEEYDVDEGNHEQPSTAPEPLRKQVLKATHHGLSGQHLQIGINTNVNISC